MQNLHLTPASIPNVRLAPSHTREPLMHVLGRLLRALFYGAFAWPFLRKPRAGRSASFNPHRNIVSDFPFL